MEKLKRMTIGFEEGIYIFEGTEEKYQEVAKAMDDGSIVEIKKVESQYHFLPSCNLKVRGNLIQWVKIENEKRTMGDF